MVSKPARPFEERYERWADEDLKQLAADIHGIIEMGGSPGDAEELGRLKEYGRAERKRALGEALFAVHNWAQAGTAIRALIDEESDAEQK